MKRSRKSVALGLTAVAALVGIGAPASAQDDGGAQAKAPVKVIADGLEGPFGLGTGGDKLYVAESGAGRITRINPTTGRAKVVAKGLRNPTGVDRVQGNLFIVTGGEEVPDASTKGDATVFLKDLDGGRRRLANLEKYELRHNPDGQTQFDPETGEPLDALSNPFAVLVRRGTARASVFVADAGANAVLSVSKSGKVSTFFVPPLVTTGACAGRPNNHPDDPTGCDPVPTGLAYGPGGRLYVSTLSGEAPRQGRVYVLDGQTGEPVGKDGAVYVSELLHNAPEGPPPPNFDPSTVGRIVRIAPDGTRTYASVTMPVGLAWFQGGLYSTAWSIAGLLGMPDRGQVVGVRQIAFS
jgi:hypothetical protein